MTHESMNHDGMDMKAQDGKALTYDAQGWIGTTFDRLVVKTEGEIATMANAWNIQ